MVTDGASRAIHREAHGLVADDLIEVKEARTRRSPEGTSLIYAATLDRIGDVVEEIGCVCVRHLPPSTTLLVRTVNSLYRVVITQGPDVYVQGGAFFPEATSAYLDGASIGGSCLRVGYICVGLLVEIRSGGRRIITSPVRAITVVQASDSVVD